MEGKLRIAGTVAESIVDGPGFRYTVFTQGCPHHCPGCHNPQTHDFDGGTEMKLSVLFADIVKNKFVRGVTLSGGEPFCQAEPLFTLAKALKEDGRHLMAFTGYTFEQLLELPDPYVQRLIGMLDLLVDGPFILAERDIELRFRGSANQRVLDVPKSLAEGAPVWAEQYR
ncbi:anaerobic ribonucleoside-triphosphate reductase activating protein [Agathobaculum sp.]|uniref:anaerobic ribonucleoside-triphosphate reductase activating protein n=1 Tax=Agathobaculum sp. TaxID=2048138 RepID=UPI002A81AE6A|nr:anaerobic ribonucleoside-triphosphate reductase activating protein [Agathobaculum sp.]MDY3617412.1 anaerobic ribonucleoside-triphosphate reductase activating protein [Agathobaculum sp.]